MVGFCVIMCLLAILLVCIGCSMLRGNHSYMHGPVYDKTTNKEALAKAVGKPILFLGCGFVVAGIVSMVMPDPYAITVALILLLLFAVIGVVWLLSVLGQFK